MTVTLEELIEKFISLQDVKPSTMAVYKQATDSLGAGEAAVACGPGQVALRLPGSP